MDRLNTFHKFLLILFLTTLLGIVALASSLSYLLRKSTVEKEVRDTAGLITALSEDGLNQEIFDLAVKELDRSTFARFVSQLMSLPEIIRVKIYDRVGNCVWSDEERLIGKKFENNRELKGASAGKVQVAMGLLKSQHMYETEKYEERKLLELYIPLLNSGSGEVYGILEIYKHPVSHFSLIDRLRAAVWILSLALVFLFASCSWLFWDALKRQKRLDKEKRFVEAQLIQAEKLAVVGEMFAGLAHEINNPLSIMMSKVRLILKDVQGANPDADLIQDLRIIDKNITRIGGIVRGLLAFSRKSKSELAPLSLNTVITESLMLVEKPFAKMNIFLDWAPAPALPEILGDANQMQQVFLNLLSNSRDAMQKGGKISIRTDALNHEGRWVIAQVRDSGEGISPEIMSRIFAPFFTTKKTREAAGLGLAVSYGIVKSHRGTIQVESQPGHGAVFTLRFPAMV